MGRGMGGGKKRGGGKAGFSLVEKKGKGTLYSFSPKYKERRLGPGKRGGGGKEKRSPFPRFPCWQEKGGKGRGRHESRLFRSETKRKGEGGEKRLLITVLGKGKKEGFFPLLRWEETGGRRKERKNLLLEGGEKKGGFLFLNYPGKRRILGKKNSRKRRKRGRKKKEYPSFSEK